MYNPFTGGEDSDEESKDTTYTPTQNELRATDRESKHDERDTSHKGDKKPNIANALLKVGTKSIKDVSLDKPVRKSPGLLLETAGRSLLQRRSLPGGGENVDGTASNGGSKGGLTFGLCSAKISFGLYGGHLDIGHPGTKAALNKTSKALSSASSATDGSDSDGRDTDTRSSHITINNGNRETYSHSSSAGGQGNDQKRSFSVRHFSNTDCGPSTANIAITSPLTKFGQLSATKVVLGSTNSEVQNTQSASQTTKKVFSNWGGEFFKKNLDYRANTNKILEKMNLTTSVPSTQNISNNMSNSYINNFKKDVTVSSNTSNGGENFKTVFGSPLSKKRPLVLPTSNSSLISTKNEPPSKKLKSSSGSSIYNSYNM